MNTNLDVQHSEEDEIGLQQLFHNLWRSRILILACMIFSGAVLTGIAFLMTPTYRATATLIPANAEKNASGVMEGALSQIGGASAIADSLGANAVDPVTAEAMAVLQSRQFIEAFIRDNGLMQKIYRTRWDAENKKWKPSLFRNEPTVTKAYEYFEKKIFVLDQDKKTTIVTLQIDWRDRNEAAYWANELVKRLNLEMRKRAIAKTASSIEYLEKELKNTTYVGTQEAINRLIETQIKLRMLANVTDEYSFRIIDNALPQDEDSPISPKKLLMLLGGIILGFFLGAIYVIGSNHLKQ